MSAWQRIPVCQTHLIEERLNSTFAFDALLQGSSLSRSRHKPACSPTINLTALHYYCDPKDIKTSSLHPALHCTASPARRDKLSNHSKNPAQLLQRLVKVLKSIQVEDLLLVFGSLSHSLHFSHYMAGKGGCQVKPRPMAFKDNLFAAKGAIFGIFEAFPKNKDFSVW